MYMLENAIRARAEQEKTGLAGIRWHELDWRRELGNNITSVDDLKEYLPLGGKEEARLRRVVEIHPMNIPRYYLSLVDLLDPKDPIRKLCIPRGDELVAGGAMGRTDEDPNGHDRHCQGNGVLHKYEYTALVLSTDYCAMYCRHCFRKRMVGLPNDRIAKNFRKAMEYVASHPEITNLIISGGDPLMLPNRVLRSMLESVREIDHLNFVRIGSRAPVSYPLRFFDDGLISLLKEFNRHKTLFIPTHFNHPGEITEVSREAVRRIRSAGITVNNQAVLLKGVNDNVEALVGLMQGLLRIGVSPYYLYQCMPAARVRHHFQVPLKRGVDLVDRARQRMDGYAKRFKFIMGHDIGKLEICGRIGDKLLLKQIHGVRGQSENGSRMMVRKLTDTGGWLDDLPIVEL